MNISLKDSGRESEDRQRMEREYKHRKGKVSGATFNRSILLDKQTENRYANESFDNDTSDSEGECLY